MLEDGSLTMAEPMLRAMVDTLAPGGLLVITGFTRSFLSPRLIVRAGSAGAVVGFVLGTFQCISARSRKCACS